MLIKNPLRAHSKKLRKRRFFEWWAERSALNGINRCFWTKKLLHSDEWSILWMFNNYSLNKHEYRLQRLDQGGGWRKERILYLWTTYLHSPTQNHAGTNRFSRRERSCMHEDWRLQETSIYLVSAGNLHWKESVNLFHLQSKWKSLKLNSLKQLRTTIQS